MKRSEMNARQRKRKDKRLEAEGGYTKEEERETGSTPGTEEL